MKNRVVIQRLVGTAMLAAIVVVLQLISNYVVFVHSITLALVPVAVGAIIFGPTSGFFLGAILGVIVLTGPGTAAYLSFNAFATVLVCILKTGLAGFAAGWIFKGLNKINFTLACVVASLVIPVINSGLFALATMTIFAKLAREWAGGSNVYSFIFLAMIGWNFVIEFALSAILAPSIMQIIKIVNKNKAE